MLDVFEIDDAVAASAKELCRVKPLFAIAKRSTDEHGRADPVDTTVVSLGFQPEKVGHAKNTTLDVVGENDEIVISKRDVPGELVNNFAGVSGGTVGLFECRKATSVFLWFVGGADWFCEWISPSWPVMSKSADFRWPKMDAVPSFLVRTPGEDSKLGTRVTN